MISENVSYGFILHFNDIRLKKFACLFTRNYFIYAIFLFFCSDPASDKDTVNECIQLANEKFDVGQVYNSSLGKQVHVYSEQGSGNIETIITY